MGIPGIPEYSLSTIAFLTISAQYRSLSFRNSNEVSIEKKFLANERAPFQRLSTTIPRHMAYLLCLGDILDAKFLAASYLVVTACSVVIYCVVWLLSKMRIVATYDLALWPHSITSYSAEMLWPVNTLMVSWRD